MYKYVLMIHIYIYIYLQLCKEHPFLFPGSQDGSKWSLGGPGGDKAIERCRPDVERHHGNTYYPPVI